MQPNRLGAVPLSLRNVEQVDPTDYSMVVKRRGGPAKPWRWEIYCACKVPPVERSSIFFESMSEATKSGKKALAHLLAELAQEVSQSNFNRFSPRRIKPVRSGI